MSVDDYVKAAIDNVKKILEADGKGLELGKAPNPFCTGHQLELDVSEELDGLMTSQFQHLIGVLRWAVELGQVNIYMEISILLQHLALPHAGHLKAIYHIFLYLHHHRWSCIVFDDYKPMKDESEFEEVDWWNIYGEVAEELLQHMPKARGTRMKIYCFVDANHAGNVVT